MSQRYCIYRNCALYKINPSLRRKKMSRSFDKLTWLHHPQIRLRASDKPSSIFDVNFDFISNYKTIAAHSLHLALLLSSLQSPTLSGPARKKPKPQTPRHSNRFSLPAATSEPDLCFRIHLATQIFPTAAYSFVLGSAQSMGICQSSKY